MSDMSLGVPGSIQGDYSQMYQSDPQSSFLGELGRTWLGQLTGANAQTDIDDWLRQEQSSNNAFVRDMLKLNEQNIFNASQSEIARQFSASEAKKARDFEERMSSTAYQRAVSDMKLAGINPVLAYMQGGASTPSASGAGSVSASSGSGSSSRGSSSPRSGSASLSSIASIIAGAISGSAQVTAAGISAAANTSTKTSISHVYSHKGG